MNLDAPNSGQLCSDTHRAITAGTTKNTAMNSTLGSTNSSPACRRANAILERGLPRSSARSSVAIASPFSTFRHRKLQIVLCSSFFALGAKNEEQKEGK